MLTYVSIHGCLSEFTISILGRCYDRAAFESLPCTNGSSGSWSVKAARTCDGHNAVSPFHPSIRPNSNISSRQSAPRHIIMRSEERSNPIGKPAQVSGPGPQHSQDRQRLIPTSRMPGCLPWLALGWVLWVRQFSACRSRFTTATRCRSSSAADGEMTDLPLRGHDGWKL